jgi:hypothetical protein
MGQEIRRNDKVDCPVKLSELHCLNSGFGPQVVVTEKYPLRSLNEVFDPF